MVCNLHKGILLLLWSICGLLSCSRQPPVIYLFPVGKMQPGTLNYLSEVLSDSLKMRIVIKKPTVLPDSLWSQVRNRYKAEKVLRYLKVQYSQTGICKYLLVTDKDLGISFGPDSLRGANGLSYQSLYPTGMSAGGGLLTSSMDYDCATGKLQASTDNQNLLTTQYEYDGYGRTTKIREGGIQTQTGTTTFLRETWHQYFDASLIVQSTRDRATYQDRALTETRYFDQLGDLRLVNSNGDLVQNLARVDSSGNRFVLSSNPYRTLSSTPAEPTLGWTMRQFDSAGRLASVKHYAGAVLPWEFGGTNSPTATLESYTYDGLTTTRTDADNKTVVTTSDPLGRLASANDSVSIVLYTYNSIDKLTLVSQTSLVGTSGTQVREFHYDTLGRLRKARQPELGSLAAAFGDIRLGI
ncbi:MAG: hypothetical protein MUF24_11200, partial [Chitinophagaceae bacterium]|nr:hypothetical protein [Chitinophagaceae bacterium]